MSRVAKFAHSFSSFLINTFASAIVLAIAYVVVLPLDPYAIAAGTFSGVLALVVCQYLKRSSLFALTFGVLGIWGTALSRPLWSSADNPIYVVRCGEISWDCATTIDVDEAIGSAIVYPVADPVRLAIWRYWPGRREGMRFVDAAIIDGETQLLHSSTEAELRDIYRESPADEFTRLTISHPIVGARANLVDATDTATPRDVWFFADLLLLEPPVLSWWSPHEPDAPGLFSEEAKSYDVRAAWRRAAIADLELRALVSMTLTEVIDYVQGQRDESDGAILRHSALILNACRYMMQGRINDVECPLIVKERAGSIAAAIRALGNEDPGAVAAANAVGLTLLPLDIVLLTTGTRPQDWVSNDGAFANEYGQVFAEVGWWPTAPASDRTLDLPTTAEELSDHMAERSRDRAVDEQARGVHPFTTITRNLSAAPDADLETLIANLPAQHRNRLALDGLPPPITMERLRLEKENFFRTRDPQSYRNLVRTYAQGRLRQQRVDQILNSQSTQASTLIAGGIRRRSQRALATDTMLQSLNALTNVSDERNAMEMLEVSVRGVLQSDESCRGGADLYGNTLAVANGARPSLDMLPDNPSYKWWDCSARLNELLEFGLFAAASGDGAENQQFVNDLRDEMWRRYSPGGPAQDRWSGLIRTHLILVKTRDPRAEATRRRMELVLGAVPNWITQFELRHEASSAASQ